jgi:predicted MFS family arabinose efflux permease
MLRPAPPYSPGYRRLVLGLLMLAYTFNSAHRSVIAVVGQAMKLDLGLTDTQLGLLMGTAFAALYALSGVPTARLAERHSRVTILALALAAWSALTAAYALTGSFVQLVLARVGVGVAEAGCSPSAHSLISDYYERRRRTSALSVYSCGLSAGYLFVSVVGGYVTAHHGWRTACVVVGLPGVAAAILLKVLVAEPPRGHGAAAAFSWGTEFQELGRIIRRLFLTWPAANMVAGLIISSFASYGSYAFLPAYFNRMYHLDYATIGIVVGLVGSVPVALGILAGGWMTDFLGERSARWYALVPAAGLALATPLYVLALTRPDWVSAAWLLAIPAFFQYVALAPSFGVIQNVVTSGQRATATALVFLGLNVLALGGGSLFTGALIDHLAQVDFAHASVSTELFSQACPGGIARSGSAAPIGAACATALGQASRTGLVVTVLLYAWAALHYLMAARGLGRQLAEAAQEEQSTSAAG